MVIRSRDFGVTRLQIELGRARGQLDLFQKLEVELAARRAELTDFLPRFAGAELPPERLTMVTGLLKELVEVQSNGELTRTLEVMSRIHQVFQDLMRLIEPAHAGVKGRVAARLMQLWSDLAQLAFTVGMESEVVERVFAVQNALLVAKFAFAASDDAALAAVFRTQVLPAARDAGALIARNQLTWITPLWPVAEVSAALDLYVTQSPDRDAIAAAGRRYGLELSPETPGREVAEARFGGMRRAAVIVADLRDPANVPAACYELGIALVLGKPIVVLGDANKLPFDIDIHAVAYDAGPGSEETLAEALERTLLLPQRPPDAGTLAGLLAAVRREFAAHPHYVDLLASSRETPLRVEALLQNLARADAASGREHAVVRSAWHRSYPAPDSRRLFHVMPFRPEWADGVKSLVAAACARHHVTYARGDGARDQRVVRAIWDDLCTATHVLVDLTGMNSNVCLELGIAHALGQNTLVVGQPATVGELFPMLEKVRISRYSNPQELERCVEDFLAHAPAAARPPAHPLDGSMIETIMRQKVAAALQHEETTHAFGRHLQATFTARGFPLTDDALSALIGNIRTYVESVPTLFEAAKVAASAADLLVTFQPVFAAATTYFQEPNDLIHDGLGLAGVLDDAYLTLTLISAASQRYLESRGTPLLQFPADVVNAHLGIRNLLGPIADQLDGYAMASLLPVLPRLQAQLNQGRSAAITSPAGNAP
jgi:uncharacterized membrane protein YkvA (DUF1232 family)